MNVIGIDLGHDGAIVELTSSGEIYDIFDMPTYETGKGSRRAYDLPKLKGRFMYMNNENMVFLEDIKSLPPGIRIQATYSLGYCRGILEAMLVMRDIRYEFVRAQQWQKHFGISKHKGDKKKQSYAIASQLFPNAELKTKRGRLLDGRSDALLIAEWGRRHLEGGL